MNNLFDPQFEQLTTKDFSFKEIPSILNDDFNEILDTNNLFDTKYISILKGCDTINIPKKIEYLVNNHIPLLELKKIDKNIDVAKEIILLFISKLTYSSLFTPNEYKDICIKYLCENLFGYVDKRVIKKIKTIIDILIKGTDKGSIIECDFKYISTKKAFGYKLTENYTYKGITKYILKTEKIKTINKINYNKRVSECMTNVISKNLLKFYSSVTIPTIQQIKRESVKLMNNEFRTKKGKLLKYRSEEEKKDRKLMDTDNYSYVDVDIEKFLFLVDDGFITPMVGGDKSGGRVVDAFTLMPSWIRKLVLVKDEKNIECDYTCLHPNLCVKIYGGNTKYITHKDVSDELNKPLNEIKIEHLSFFNKKYFSMKNSCLWEFYIKNESTMLGNIIREKGNGTKKDGHKITSKRLFKLEVQIMTEVIKRLNKINIYTGYIYDALFCSPKELVIVKQMMNNVIKEFGVYTTSK